MLQPPQLACDFEVSEHAAFIPMPHIMIVPPSGMHLHAPISHVSPVVQALPHWPQFWFDVVVFVSQPVLPALRASRHFRPKSH